MTTTFEQLCAILVKDYHVEPGLLRSDAPLEGLGIDSLGAAELLWSVEDVFKIQLPPDRVLLPTIGDVVRYIDDTIAMHSGLAQSIVGEVSQRPPP
jgi:acyl carrier protein